MKQMIKSVFDEDEKGKNRKYTFDSVIEILKCIRQEKVEFCNAKTHMITEPTEDQRRILNLLGITIRS